MKRADLVSGIVLAAFGLVMLIAVIPAQIEQAPEGYVSPRLVPNMMMIVIVALSSILTLSSMRPSGASEQAQRPVFSRGEMIALLKIAVAFAVSIGLFLLGSAIAAGAALVVGTLLLLGERRPLILILMPAGLLLAGWALFSQVLGTVIV